MKESLQSGRSIFKRCKRCNEVFEIENASARQSKYCPECRDEAYREAKREWRWGGLAASRDAVSTKARERARFFAARDQAFERAGLPKPILTRASDGSRIENRGRIPGGNTTTPREFAPAPALDSMIRTSRESRALMDHLLKLQHKKESK